MWVAGLDVPPSRLGFLAGLLSADERERAGRFHFPRDRDRFVAGRGQLRELLGRYLRRPPDGLRFRYSAYGKPGLEESGGLHFNVSHSGHMVLYALTRCADVGVDVELERPGLADDRIPERFFAPREVAALRRLPPAQQVRGFLTCWTRKEAFIKARGEGLSLPLHDFEVTLAPGEEPRLLRTAWAPAEAAKWSLRDLSDYCPGAVAALAVRAVSPRIEIRARGADPEPR